MVNKTINLFYRIQMSKLRNCLNYLGKSAGIRLNPISNRA